MTQNFFFNHKYDDRRIQTWSFTINEGGELGQIMRSQHDGDVKITYVNGRFDTINISVVDISNRQSWNVLRAIANKLDEIEASIENEGSLTLRSPGTRKLNVKGKRNEQDKT